MIAQPLPPTVKSLDAIPAELRNRRQWVAWTIERTRSPDGSTAARKVPRNPNAPGNARVDSPETWGSLQEALDAALYFECRGIGYVFTEDDPYCGLDLDHVVKDGVIDPKARAILSSLNSYSEFSQSGNGIHAIVKARLPGKGRKRNGIELYDRGRFFVVTGARVPDTPATIEARQEEIARLYHELDGRPERPASAGDPPPHKDRRVERARAYVAKMPPAISGQGGHGQTFAVACVLFRFGLSDPDALALLREYNLRCQPPWTETELQHKLRDARERVSRNGEFGSSLNREARGDPILVPGSHRVGASTIEVGNDDFVRNVLDHLPPGVLYRMGEIVGTIEGEVGARAFIVATDQSLRVTIDRHVRLVRRRDEALEDGTIQENETYLPLTRDLAGVLKAAAAVDSKVRELRALVRHPVLLPGLVVASAGWNPASGIFYDEPPEIAGLVPDKDVAHAVEILRDLLVDFPFRDEADLHNAIGLMVTLIARPAICGAVPAHLAVASLERTGKGKLLDAIGNATQGTTPIRIQTGAREEETEKRITALILQGAGVVHFDNIPTESVLDSASIASLVTSYPTWSGRVLGSSRSVTLPNTMVVTLSGNNTKASSEMTKRIVPIFLRPLDGRPEARSNFNHPNIEEYAISRRREVLAAILGLALAWKEAGGPAAGHRRRIGGFERWSEIVGGILAYAGLELWLANYREWCSDADEWSRDAERLVEEWDRQHGGAAVTPKQILVIVESLEIFPEVLAKHADGRLVALGRRVLRPLIDRPVRHWRVRRVQSGNASLYSLTTESSGPRGDPTCGPTPPPGGREPGDLDESPGGPAGQADSGWESSESSGEGEEPDVLAEDSEDSEDCYVGLSRTRARGVPSSIQRATGETSETSESSGRTVGAPPDWPTRMAPRGGG